MKNRLWRVVCLAGSIGAFTATVNAQDALANVHIPFEFAAGGKMLPAGDYMLESDMSSVLVIRGTARSAALLMVTEGPAVAGSKAELTFERRNGELFLSGVKLPERTFYLTPRLLKASQITARASSPELAGTK